jgi:hypothetical protein
MILGFNETDVEKDEWKRYANVSSAEALIGWGCQVVAKRNTG